MEEKRTRLPMIALRGAVVLPKMATHIDVTKEEFIKGIQEAIEGEKRIFLTGQKNLRTKELKLENMYSMGVIAVIRQVVKLPHNVLRVFVTGQCRAGLLQMERNKSYLEAEVAEVPDAFQGQLGELEQNALVRDLEESFLKYMEKGPKLPEELDIYGIVMAEDKDWLRLADEIAAVIPFPRKDKQEILEELDPMKRYELVSSMLEREIQVNQIRIEISRKVKKRLDEHQREYVLREQLKVIREELGEDNVLSDAEMFEKEVKNLRAPKEVKERLAREVGRFKSAMHSPSEAGVIRTYIETLLEMPWNQKAKEHEDLKKAKKVLEQDHYGLEEVKERVLEFLAVRILTKKISSPILCLVGPPGTGKTSIARSLAKALNRPYVRISLGGVRDEAEIRGHRKTYIGAMPGRIATALRTAKVKNPVMLLDEIDKISTDYKGDTFSALLEVLDSEQNTGFRDHYLEVPMDLSEVLFVATANSLQTIPAPLRDRMELIEVTSYTENEKMHIAKEHLIPKQLKRHGLKKSQVTFQKQAIWDMIRYYTREAGVRQLERKIGEICRKAAREILEELQEKITIKTGNLEQYLGKQKFRYQMKNDSDQVGIARGLAWTSVGGDTLQIEVNVMSGKGEVILTGQLGDIMKESAMAGISYIRSVSRKYKIAEDYFEKNDVHIHIPEGAVPKDGPSAGITMATAILSAVTGKKVHADVAMTGEITLRGRVLPVGGLKEKLLAASHVGMKKVLVPQENRRDVEELSGEVTDALTICYVAEMKEVLKEALV